MQFVGSVSAVRLALSSLYFLPAEDWSGVAQLDVRVADASLAGNTARSYIAVESENDAPVVIVSAPYFLTPEDTTVVVPAVLFVDPDLPLDGVLQVILEVTQGTLNLNLSALTAGSTHSTNQVQLLEGGGDGNTRLVVVGQVQDLNAVFATALQFVPLSQMNLNWGEELSTGVITVSVREFDVKSSAVLNEATTAAHPHSSASMKVYVSAVNNAPVIDAPVVIKSTEDAQLLLTGFAVSDSDWHETAGAVLRANVSVMFGSLSADAAVMREMGRYRNPVTGSTSAPASAQDSASSVAADAYNSRLTFWASNPADLNRLLASVTYTPPPDRNGEDYLEITATDSAEGADVVVAHTTILLAAVNDPPVITAPAHIVAAEDTVYSIASVRVEDVDFVTNPLPSAVLTATLSCVHGQIKLTGELYLI